MSSKIQSVLYAALSGLTGFIAWLATVPPEAQSGILAQLVELVPVQWRPGVGLACRLFTFGSGLYATYLAAHSGPQTPPKNPPQ